MANENSILYRLGKSINEATPKIVNNESELSSTAKDGSLAIVVGGGVPYMVFKYGSSWYNSSPSIVDGAVTTETGDPLATESGDTISFEPA